MAAANKNSLYVRVMITYFIIVLLGLIIPIRILQLMYFPGKEVKRMVEDRKRTILTKVPALKGRIYSIDGCILATSVPLFNVRIDLHKSTINNDLFNEDIKALSDSLSLMFPQKSSAQYLKELKKGRSKNQRNYLVASKINFIQLQRLKAFPILEKGQFQGGLIVEEIYKRENPYGILGKRTIGYYRENSPKVGLEGAYDVQLSGVNGLRYERYIGNNMWRPDSILVQPKNGSDIVSTIDIRIQDVAENALKKCLESNDAQYGCAVLMEVATGEIRAIANLTKNQTTGAYEEVLNYAIAFAEEPGSTFKTATAIAVLEEGKFDTSCRVPTGKRNFFGETMEDSHPEGYGNVSFARAFQVSSNVGIAVICDSTFKKNPQKFVDYLSKMHLNAPLGIELQGEAVPVIPNPKNKKEWSAVSLFWIPTGYGITVTPLQILTLYNAVANDGKMMKPQFVKEIRSAGKVEQHIAPEVLVDQIASIKTINKVKAMLESVVTEGGTAKSLSKSPYKIAGKTGTAQANYAEKGAKMKYRASFVGYFPADNPAYSCIVLVGDPSKNRIYGGEVAAPAFKEIADKVYATLLPITHNYEDVKDLRIPYAAAGYADDLKTIYSAFNFNYTASSNAVAFVRGTAVDTTKFRYDAMSTYLNIVPDVKGMGARDAIYMLEKTGLKVVVQGKGYVKEQSLNAGEPFLKGQTIVIKLA